MSTNYQERYNRWWKGKRCRIAYQTTAFRRVTCVELVGPPSFVYGFVTLHFEDGSYDNVAPVHAFRPRKCDVEVHPDDLPKKQPKQLAVGYPLTAKQAERELDAAERTALRHNKP